MVRIIKTKSHYPPEFDWYLARKVGSRMRIPLKFSNNLICDVSGKTYKREEVEWLNEANVSVVKHGYSTWHRMYDNLMQQFIQQQKDYEEVLQDHQRLVKELDIVINSNGAAEQASLCDIVSQVERKSNRGMQWVNCSDRMPFDDSHEDYPLKYIMKCHNDERRGDVFIHHVNYEEMGHLMQGYDYCEWIDETLLSSSLSELIKAQDEYIKLLSDELSELAGTADVHGWRSSRVVQGEMLRNKILQLKLNK